MIHNLKYLTIDDLERLSKNLQEEIADIKSRVEEYGSDFHRENLKYSEDLLHHVEAEILERTLLQQSTDGGVSN